MDKTTSDQELPVGMSLRILPILGTAAIVAFALAWCDKLPGGYFLRGLVESNSIRGQRELEQHASARLSLFEEQNARAPRDAIVFMGSSTIERFPLDVCFPGKLCLNRGILSASAPMIEHFIDALLPRVPVSGVVLYSGSIELRQPGSSTDSARADEIAANVRSVLDALRRKQPQVPIGLIGVLPTRHMSPAEVQTLARLNARLSELTHERGIDFIDTARAPITSAAGSLVEELSADELHLDDRGYEVLSRWIIADGGEVGRRLAP